MKNKLNNNPIYIELKSNPIYIELKGGIKKYE